MTAGEFAFLALGLVLGVATGAALVEVLRSRPPARREVRVTVAPNSIARRRAATLADIAPGDAGSGPARGGPGDRRWMDREVPDEDPRAAPSGPILEGETGDGNLVPSAADGRTHVPAAGAPPLRLAGAGSNSVGIAIAREPDPMMAALRASTGDRSRFLTPSGIETSPVVATREASVATMSRTVDAVDAAAAAEDTTGHGRAAEARPGEARAGEAAVGEAAVGEAPLGQGQTEGAAPATDRGDAIAGACDEPRRIADERCQVATRAREGAQSALEALRTAQHAYDDHAKQAETYTATADPRAVRTAKEAAQQAFRVARSSGRTRDDVETAAREWLTEINRINHATREASALAERHRITAAELAGSLERLSVEADAARISAESAEEACVAAREAVAACQEAAAVLAAGGRTKGPSTAQAPGRGRAADGPFEEEESTGSRAGEDAVIIRLLRGDREVLGRLVARLGGDDPAERKRWQTSIGGLLEAFVARSIEASSFDFPTAHPFWGPFTRSQCRDIAAALSSLGYRHDGFGGWADDHMPTQRDLSLAVGYAGLDPMRIRHWPAEAEMRELLREVTVAADEYVWEAAGSLTLGELVTLLGRRADALTELWNEWGVVRPLLLAAE